jgi:hypothetical protein
MIKKVVGNERGIALMMVLVISTIAISVMSALIFMLTSGTQMSGIQKRYSTALEAADGGQEATLRTIGVRGDPGFSNAIPFTYDSGGCMEAKLLNSTAFDPSFPNQTGWGDCDSSLIINSSDSSTYDLSLDMGGYMSYMKIVNTVFGNSGSDEGLIKSGVVMANAGDIPVQSRPYIYSIEVDTRSNSNSEEKAKLSILYQY